MQDNKIICILFLGTNVVSDNIHLMERWRETCKGIYISVKNQV